MVAKGCEKEFAEKIFKQLEGFGSYGSKRKSTVCPIATRPSRCQVSFGTATMATRFQVSCPMTTVIPSCRSVAARIVCSMTFSAAPIMRHGSFGMGCLKRRFRRWDREHFLPGTRRTISFTYRLNNRVILFFTPLIGPHCSCYT